MATAKVIIKGDNQLKQPLSQASQQLTSFGSAASSAGKMLSTALGAAAVALIVKGLKELAKATAECVKEFKKQVEVETRLNSIIKATGQQYVTTGAEMKEYASNLQSVTRFGDDAVESAASLLLATKKFTKEGLERTLELSADLAEAMGTDLPNAASTLERALIEPGEGLARLKTIGVTFTETEKEMITELKNAGKEFEAQQIILDKVEAAYGGVAKSVASIDTSTLDKIKNVWGDLKEDLGSMATTMFSGLFEFVYGGLRRLQRLANQIAEQGSFNKYLANNDVQGLADNFTTEYLQLQLQKDQYNYDKIAESLKEEWAGVWHDIMVDFETDFDQFVRLDRKTQIEYLRDLYPDNYMKGDAFLGALNQLNEPIRILKAIEIQQNDIFIAEQKAAAQAAAEAEEAAAEAAKQEKENFDNAVSAILKKYGEMDEAYRVRTIEEEIQTIENLLANPSISSADAQTLQIALDYNRQLLEEINRLNANLNDIYGEVHGISSGISFKIESPVFELDDKLFSFNHNNPLLYGNGLNGADTLSILGSEGVKNLNIVPKEVTDKISSISTLLDKYIGLSSTYQREQENLVIEEIATLEEALEFIKEIDPENKLITYLPEIVEVLKERLPKPEESAAEPPEVSIIKKIGPITLEGAEAIEKFNTAVNQVFSDFTSQTGEFGDVVSRLVTNMSTLGPLLGAIVTALHYVIQGFVEVFGDLLQEFVYYGLEPLREIGRVIAEIIMPMLEEFMPSIQQSADILIQIFDAIGIVLRPIAVLIGTVLGPILKLITNFLEYVLLPILKGIASIFLLITSAVEWFADVIKWVVQSIKSWFGGPAPDRIRGFTEIYEGHMNEMWMGEGSSGSYGAAGTTNASYQGSTTVYLNVFNYGTVVGDDGISEFAIMIRDELENINYYRR